MGNLTFGRENPGKVREFQKTVAVATMTLCLFLFYLSVPGNWHRIHFFKPMCVDYLVDRCRNLSLFLLREVFVLNSNILKVRNRDVIFPDGGRVTRPGALLIVHFKVIVFPQA